MPKPNAPIRRNTLGDISVLHVDVLARAVQHQGCDPAPLLAQFNLSPAILASTDARISIPRFMRLGHAAIEHTGNPNLGLVMGALSRPVDAGRAGLAGAAAATASDALATLIRFALLTSRNSRGQPSMTRAPDQARFYSIRPYNRFNFFVVDSVLATWVQFLRTVSGQQQVAEEVWIEYPSQGQEAAFEAWFGCPVHFGAPENRLQLNSQMADTRCQDAQAAVHQLLVEECSQDLKRRQAGWSLGERIKEKLAAQLAERPPELAAMAAEFGLTPWTLQRHLAAEGRGYRELLDDTRKDLAQDYLAETSLSFAEISWLLGFANPAAFHKAYRRWFGISPGQHRRVLKGATETYSSMGSP